MAALRVRGRVDGEVSYRDVDRVETVLELEPDMAMEKGGTDAG